MKKVLVFLAAVSLLAQDPVVRALDPRGVDGQLLISHGPSTNPTFEDPIVSYNYVPMLDDVAATGTQTSSAIRLPIFSAYGVLHVTGAGITGSPSGCTLDLRFQSSTGTPNSGVISSTAFTPASSYQAFTITPTIALGDKLIVVFACSSAYPSAGTISVGFNSAFHTNISGTLAVTQSGTWDLRNITGTITLPTGAATETTLSTLNAKIPASPSTDRTTAAGPFSVRLSDGAAFYNAPVGTQLPPALSSGRLIVDGSQVTQPVSGTVTANAGSGNFTVINGGTFAVQASQTGSWTVSGTGTAGAAATGVVTVQGIASMTPVQVSQATASNLNAAVVGLGTAGSASGGVLTVQGVASMTPVLVTNATANNFLAQVFGAAADGAAVSGNPVRIGGKDGSGNTQDIITDTNGQVVVVGPGTSGAPSGGVQSVQGPSIDGATPGAFSPMLIGGIASGNIVRFFGLADGMTDATTGGRALPVAPEYFNGTNFDRVRGNTSGAFNVPATTTSTTPTALQCILISAASTNATSCKASAGNVYGFRFVNTTATVYYLRMYNLAAAPTCSSSSGFIESIPLPGLTTGAVLVDNNHFGVQYGTGIAFCVTLSSGSTANDNAATGIFGSIYYK